MTGEYGVKKVNISGMQFLKIGQGARAVAMGDAFTAVADDINAIFWNGSGLVHVERVAYQANWTRFLLDTQLYSAAAVWNTRSARGEVLGIAVTSHNPKPSKETTIYQPNGTGPGRDSYIISPSVCSMRSSSRTSSRSARRRTTFRRSSTR